jgi:hypothetical protein
MPVGTHQPTGMPEYVDGQPQPATALQVLLVVVTLHMSHATMSSATFVWQMWAASEDAGGVCTSMKSCAK